jgi:UMF1 family MFS transporter
LEQLARERGVFWSDKSTPCTAKAPGGAASVVANATAAAVRNLARATVERDKDQCVVNIAGFEVTTASFAMYTFSLAVLVQAISLVSFSAVADHGKL